VKVAWHEMPGRCPQTDPSRRDGMLGSSPEEHHYAYLTPRLMTRFEVGIKRETFSFIVVSM
jgi:hypothetical protein